MLAIVVRAASCLASAILRGAPLAAMIENPNIPDRGPSLAGRRSSNVQQFQRMGERVAAYRARSGGPHGRAGPRNAGAHGAPGGIVRARAFAGAQFWRPELSGAKSEKEGGRANFRQPTESGAGKTGCFRPIAKAFGLRDGHPRLGLGSATERLAVA